MAETNLAFSKIVATPTPTAWSQAYSAGRLFAALSLQSETVPQEEEENLNSVGKDLISILESEFFTLENKDLESIKQAILTTTARIREGVKASFVVCYLSENVLYLFASGGGKAILKRGEKIGTVLEGDEDTNIKTASGYVQDGDVIILQTKPFQKVIPPSTLASSLDNDNPEDIAEDLAPHVHERAEGGASAVFLVYKKGMADTSPAAPLEVESLSNESQRPDGGVEEKAEEPEISEKEEIAEEVKETAPSEEVKPQTQPVEKTPPFLTGEREARRKLSFAAPLELLKRLPISRLSHQRKIILTIAAILIVLIVVSSFIVLGGRQDSENKKLFESIISQAQEKFDEGQNLKDLNAPLAQESFRDAKRILDENKDKFPQGSDEDRKIEELLANVNSQVSKAGEGENVSAKEVEKGESKLLSYEIDNPKASYFTQNEDFVYFTDGSGISRIDKGNNDKEEIIKKSWDIPGGIGLFGSNVYLLDKKNGVLKFVPAEDKFSQTNYFSGDSPDFGNATAMAIDGSVYVLFDDGDIKKYTRGNEDSFGVSGVEKAMSNPTRIFTNEDSDNIYVLDTGNSRIVVLDKEGKFVSFYSANVVKSAKDFDVNEANKKIFILSSDKVYQIDLK